jgi:hypothetical protein
MNAGNAQSANQPHEQPRGKVPGFIRKSVAVVAHGLSARSPVSLHSQVNGALGRREEAFRVMEALLRPGFNVLSCGRSPIDQDPRAGKMYDSLSSWFIFG